jgi:hypothetical protein
MLFRIMLGCTVLEKGLSNVSASSSGTSLHPILAPRPAGLLFHPAPHALWTCTPPCRPLVTEVAPPPPRQAISYRRSTVAPSSRQREIINLNHWVPPPLSALIHRHCHESNSRQHSLTPQMVGLSSLSKGRTKDFLIRKIRCLILH